MLHGIVRFMIMFSDKNECCRILNISIIVLGILTCGTSVLLWWLSKGVTECMCGNNKKKYSLKGTVRTYKCIAIYLCT